jgi:hypothetical protein
MNSEKRKELKKKEKLGMPYGTAAHRLRKNILFHLLKSYDDNNCFKCGEKILEVKDLSVEHKIPWLNSDSPKELFFDMNNIAFSHLKCNIGSRKGTTRKKTES